MRFGLATIQMLLDGVIDEQNDLFERIKELSTNPELTGELLSRVTDTAVRYDRLSAALAHIIHWNNLPRWRRIFGLRISL